jgi:hypothetical protein
MGLSREVQEHQAGKTDSFVTSLRYDEEGKGELTVGANPS